MTVRRRSDRPLVEVNRWLWSEVTKRVKIRDGWRCRWADATCDGRLEVDHIVPRFEGGGDELYNLRTLCRRHHVLRLYGATGPTDRRPLPPRPTIFGPRLVSREPSRVIRGDYSRKRP